ncbi:MAG: nucleotide exchange factor GrpE [Elusimicrobiota bacterium]|nr:nucleotide exchange factor GrpE [Elusimicrobiota bacterium]
MKDKNKNRKETSEKPGGIDEATEKAILDNVLTSAGSDAPDKTLITPATKEKIEELKLLAASLGKEKEKSENYYNQLVSLKAEFDNYRKRSQKESAQMASYGKENVIKEFLPVMDNVLRLEETGNKTDPSSGEGMKIIIKELKKIFAALGVKQMECMGKEFSPHVHEAVFKEKTNDFKDGTVVKIVSNGYYLGCEVLKPAMVVVAENVAEAEPKTPADASNDKAEAEPKTPADASNDKDDK